LERYCAAHPHAADTADGARRWWLADPTLFLDEVELALEALVSRGVLATRVLPDGVAFYFVPRADGDGS